MDDRQYMWVYGLFYIVFDFINYVLCDICKTELFAKRNYLHYVYIVRDDKLRCSMLDIVYSYEYTVECRYNAVQYNTICYTALR